MKVITAVDDPGIYISKLERKQAIVSVKGTAPLIVHRFDEKAKRQMLEKQMGATRMKKEPKDPQADYERSLHRLPDGSAGFPATGFKAATIGAARYFDGVKMTELRRALFFTGEGEDQLVKIEGEHHMREDMVRISMGTADLRYRAQFDDWSATLKIWYMPSMLSLESLINLVDAGGSGGIGEWRPSKSDSGLFGTYEVVAD